MADHLRRSPSLSFGRRVDPNYTYPREDTLMALASLPYKNAAIKA